MKELNWGEKKMNESQETEETSKFHREFMSPTLFLFELLKKVNQRTIGPVSLT